MTKKEVLVYIADGCAVWEIGYATAAINKAQTDYVIKTFSLDDRIKTSMGGLRIVPDYTLDNCPDDFAMLILPGGTNWKNEDLKLRDIIEYSLKRDIPIAAICDAVGFLAEQGCLDNIDHTGNSLDYLKQTSPNYKGEAHFKEVQAVSTANIITANGTSAVEFAREILKKLEVIPEIEINRWYQIFKEGLHPEITVAH